MIGITEINNIRDISTWKMSWKELLGKTRQASFFQSPEWLETYWTHFGQGKKLRIVVVSMNSKPIGIVPLVVKQTPTRLGSLKVLTCPLDGWGSTFGPIGSSAAATLVSTFRHINNTRRDWDMLDFRSVDTHGIDRRRVETALKSTGYQSYQRPWDRRSVVEMEDLDWETYWSTRSAETRIGFQDAERSLSENGEVRLVRHRPEGSALGDGDPNWTLFTAAECMSAYSPTDRRFLREAHRHAVHSGMTDLNVLYVGRKPVASAYSYYNAGVLENIHTSVAPGENRNASMVLLGKMLQDSFERKDRKFIFGTGCADQKRYWQTSVQTTFRYSHFPLLAPRSQVFRFNHMLKNFLHKDAGHEAEIQQVPHVVEPTHGFSVVG